MITNFKYNYRNLFTPIIFRKDFRSATISATQAWSLFFTAGQDEDAFGENPETGWFFNYLLISWALACASAMVIFNSNIL